MTNRVIVFTSIFTVIAVALLAWFLVAQFRANALQALESVQQAQLFNLLAEVDADDQGQLVGRPQMGDQRFDQLGSGWYWQASLIDTDSRPLRSVSLDGADVSRVSIAQAPFDEAFQRSYLVPDPGGIMLRVVETEFEVGDNGVAIRLQTTANFSQFEAGIDALRRNIIGVLSAFAVGMLLLNALLIRIGLRPLTRAKEQLVDVQSGKASRLEGRYPAEIAPLAAEINTLIDNNRRVVDRARTQVGNLAHALKTPIAVLRNEASNAENVKGNFVTQQVEEMNLYVQNYLQRAQIAAQSGGAVFRADAIAISRKLVGVMAKLNPEKTVEFHCEEEHLTFAGEKSDLEEILGNLLENATKWSTSRVRYSLSSSASDAGNLELIIEDDGPGIPTEMRTQALKRGKRLDESVPGTGLGLSIVGDTVDAYNGKLSLNASELGGLSVSIELPKAAD